MDTETLFRSQSPHDGETQTLLMGGLPLSQATTARAVNSCCQVASNWWFQDLAEDPQGLAKMKLPVVALKPVIANAWPLTRFVLPFPPVVLPKDPTHRLRPALKAAIALARKLFQVVRLLFADCQPVFP